MNQRKRTIVLYLIVTRKDCKQYSDSLAATGSQRNSGGGGGGGGGGNNHEKNKAGLAKVGDCAAF